MVRCKYLNMEEDELMDIGTLVVHLSIRLEHIRESVDSHHSCQADVRLLQWTEICEGIVCLLAQSRG